MERKFTPGNWQIWTNADGTTYLTNEGQQPIMSGYKDDDNAKRVALVDLQTEGIKRKEMWHSYCEERTANAKLIALAPKLLEALEATVNDLEIMKDGNL